jgi:DNA repair protein RecN (Recombination protein N)
VFALDDDLVARVGERLAPDAEELVLARRVGADGRTRAYVNGRSATLADLRELAGELISFYGQHEHRNLTLASRQLDILDAYCGPEQLTRRASCAAAHAGLRRLEARLLEARALAGAREREGDLLDFELEEIERAAPDEGEYEALQARRQLLRRIDALRDAAAEASAALLGGDDAEGGARDLLARAAGRLESVGGADAELDGLTVRLNALAVEAEDVSGELARYGEQLEAQPGELEAVDERLAALTRLLRKHGGTIALVLEHARACRERRAVLDGAQDDCDRLAAEAQQAQRELDRLVAELRAARADAGPRLAGEVCTRLAELAMPGATFEVALSERAPGPTGGDGVELMIATNPGVAAGPVRDIASGGELSRIMLALMGVCSDGTGATLVFDEVDAGIGGHTARAVGEQLRGLGSSHQVLCITHLPQIASLGDRHFSVVKDTSADPTRAAVLQLAEGDVVSELVRMLGADEADSTARRHARDLRKAA